VVETSVRARRRALAPSITSSSGRPVSKPRSRKPTSRSPSCYRLGGSSQSPGKGLASRECW
jgi:hypothetical protein